MGLTNKNWDRNQKQIHITTAHAPLPTPAAQPTPPPPPPIQPRHCRPRPVQSHNTEPQTSQRDQNNKRRVTHHHHHHHHRPRPSTTHHQPPTTKNAASTPTNRKPTATVPPPSTTLPSLASAGQIAPMRLHERESARSAPIYTREPHVLSTRRCNQTKIHPPCLRTTTPAIFVHTPTSTSMQSR